MDSPILRGSYDLACSGASRARELSRLSSMGCTLRRFAPRIVSNGLPRLVVFGRASAIAARPGGGMLTTTFRIGSAH